jgi:hypothetical protein
VNDAARIRTLIPDVIAAAGADLTGLVVYTEAASGPYLWTPVLAACAGARRVYALARDSHHHTAASSAAATAEAADWMGVRVEVVTAKRPEHLAEADIVTNSAGVRPIAAQDVTALKPTAVIPLMWETWEFRPADLDLGACREHGILVLGTYEDREPCDMRPYLRMLVVKLLLEMGLEVHRTRVVLLGRQRVPGLAMEGYLRDLGAEVVTFSAPGDGGRPYEELGPYLRQSHGRHDAVVVAEHILPDVLLGPGGHAAPEDLDPALRIGVISGVVDAPALRAAGLHVHPEHIRGHLYMSYEPVVLGPRPILELYAAGLAVGAAAARARLSGLDVAAAAARAIETSPAMDFEGELAWCP